jgi:hypothetical protein
MSGWFWIILSDFIEKLIGVQGARLLRDQRASYLSILLARQATRKLARQDFLVDAGAVLHISSTKAHLTPRGKRASWSGDQQLLTKK